MVGSDKRKNVRRMNAMKYMPCWYIQRDAKR